MAPTLTDLVVLDCGKHQVALFSGVASGAGYAANGGSARGNRAGTRGTPIMSNSEPQITQKLDIAALSLALIPIVLGMFSNPAPWDITSFIISFTFVLIILAYSWDHSRSWLQSLTLAAAIALASLPATGFVFEAKHHGSLDTYIPSPNDEKPPPSSVHANEQAYAWISILVLTCIADRIFQRKRQVAVANKQE
jgi:hypothetical protein